ncbi:hypothetical protein CRE_15624 [Caenorhabditis remanei]|uniref:Uncharacterized protein n=1 Tax=Caenorhabditis remanei TaxID=31234 RepID=E3N2Q4_CAERE|nr:hypothetical protein CRE_15624 [Caenorhabditis remanei]
MKLYLKTLTNLSSPISPEASEDIVAFIDHYAKTVCHAWFPIVMIGLYALKLVKKQYFQFLTILKIKNNYKQEIPFSADICITNFYYIPFIWILTPYISYSGPVQSWLRRKTKKTEDSDFQMAHISIDY